MYSKELQKLLKEKKVGVGDRINLDSYEGVLMPSPDMGSENHLILKLDNGYNVGVKFSKKTKLEKSKSKTPNSIEKKLVFEEDHHHKKQLNKPVNKNISLLMTGGTIASKIDYKTGAVSAALDSNDLFALVPELDEIGFFHMKTISEKMSEDILPEDWIAMAKETYSQLKKNKGVILAHGTDTMHFSSAALSFMIQTDKPVVFTGSQRSSDRGSSDAAMNLICASHVALSDIAEVGVCMHANTSDDYCYFLRGTKVRKMHSSQRNAFRPINDLPLAEVFPDGKINSLQEHSKRNFKKLSLNAKFDDSIALVKAYPGANPSILNQDVKGVIIEGTGLGHVPTNNSKSWIPTIKELTESGVFVGVTTQCLYGSVHPSVYSNLRTLFEYATPLGDMLPETAYVKLGWSLGMKDVSLMTKNIAGEFNTRLQEEMFLK